MELIFASHNNNKLKEIAKILPKKIKLIGLDELGVTKEIPETEATLEGNACLKADWIFQRYNRAVFADDTGLEIESLDGRPGVYSARYAGEQKSAEANMDKILSEMKGMENRRAKFRTVISFISKKGESFLFEGEVLGEILEERQGKEGFGYDPIFKADGMEKSFAEVSLKEKNQVSHRARATKKFVAYLSSIL